MELLYLSIPLISCMLCIIFSFSYFYPKTRSRNLTINLPPGTTGWPIIGETIEYVNAHRRGTTEKFFEDRFQKYSKKIFRTTLLGEQFAALHGAAGNKFIFSSQDKVLHRWWPKSVGRIFSSVIGSSLEEASEKVRRLILKCLSNEALQRYTGIVDNLAKKHFEIHWHNREEVNVFSLVKEYNTLLGCRLFLNIDDPSQVKEFGQLVGDITAGIASVPINLPGGKFNRAIKAATLLLNKLAAIAKQRKIELLKKRSTSSPTSVLDELSHLLILCNDEEGQSFNEFDVGKQMVPLLVGAGESTNSTISHVMKFLAENPPVYRKVFKEQMEIAKSKAPGELLSWKDVQKMKYLWNVVCETLRLISPGSGSFRVATTDINYEGFTIPKGWKVQWSANWIHMNPEYFPEPKTFDPSRFEGNGPAPYTYVPFGGGSRMCPGKEHAKLAALVFIHNAVIKFKWEKIIPDENTTIRDGIPIPAKGLPVLLSKLS